MVSFASLPQRSSSARTRSAASSTNPNATAKRCRANPRATVFQAWATGVGLNFGGSPWLPDRKDFGPRVGFAYDLVGNGIELAGGSFRIHEPELQAKLFDLLKISPEEQRVKFGFLLDALAMGAPPHGGIASGMERVLMALLDEPYIRELVAFPKNQAGVDPMSGAPTRVEPAQLRELGLEVKVEDDLSDQGSK